MNDALATALRTMETRAADLEKCIDQLDSQPRPSHNQRAKLVGRANEAARCAKLLRDLVDPPTMNTPAGPVAVGDKVVCEFSEAGPATGGPTYKVGGEVTYIGSEFGLKFDVDLSGWNAPDVLRRELELTEDDEIGVLDNTQPESVVEIVQS